jgi:hypothetical protein
MLPLTHNVIWRPTSDGGGPDPTDSGVSCLLLKARAAYAGAGQRGNWTTRDETRFLCIRKPSNYDAVVYAQPPESVRLWLSETTPSSVRSGSRIPGRYVPDGHIPGWQPPSSCISGGRVTRVPARLVEFEAVVAW